MKKIILGLLLVSTTAAFAQTDSTKSPFTIGGYLETYYSYEFSNPANHNRPNFMYSHNRHNEVNINLGFVKAAYQTTNVRANLALAVGTYMNANLASEPGVLKHIYEANAGVKISKGHNLWIDAGVFSSHLGFESAIGKDNWTLTRGLYAENSPYFETGAKITYITKDDKWTISGLLLNGWQNIQRVEGNSTPAFGHQVMYKPNSKITLNSSSFIGNTKPDSIKQMRYFHNLYGIFQVSEKISFTAGLDIGAEQKSKASREYNTWYTPVIIIKYTPTAKQNFAARVEYFNDENGVIIGTGTVNGFQTVGYSLNYDRVIRDNVMWRIEGRGLSSKDPIFITDKKSNNKNIFFVTTSLAISF